MKPFESKEQKLKRRYAALGESHLAKCMNCGETFLRTRAWKKFCNKSCQQEHFWKTHQIVKK